MTRFEQKSTELYHLKAENIDLYRQIADLKQTILDTEVEREERITDARREEEVRKELELLLEGTVAGLEATGSSPQVAEAMRLLEEVSKKQVVEIEELKGKVEGLEEEKRSVESDGWQRMYRGSHQQWVTRKNAEREREGRKEEERLGKRIEELEREKERLEKRLRDAGMKQKNSDARTRAVKQEFAEIKEEELGSEPVTRRSTRSRTLKQREEDA